MAEGTDAGGIIAAPGWSEEIKTALGRETPATSTSALWRPRRWSGLRGPVLISVVALLVWVLTEWRHDSWGTLPVTPVAVLTFLGVQMAAPRLRWSPQHILGPANVALLLFGLQLTVIPVCIALFGPFQHALLSMPAARFFNVALLLQAVGYVSYAVGFAVLSHRRRGPVLVVPRIAPLGWVFVAIGLVGLVLRFPSIGELVRYFRGEGDVFTDDDSLAGAAGTFLRPFLTFGFVVLVCDRWQRHRSAAGIVNVLLLGGALAAAATFDYNRAAVVVPAIALLAVYHRHVRRIRPARLALIAALLLFIGVRFGDYRLTYVGTLGGTVTEEQANLPKEGATLADQLQVYGNGPQFWGVVIRDVHDGGGWRWGSTIPGSLLQPVPVIGEPFRPSSGPVQYNVLVYSQPGITDQILGFGAELYWNFSIVGVVVGYGLLGALVRHLDERSRASQSAVVTFGYSFIGIWAALTVVNSLSILVQIFVYFMSPILLLLLWRRATGTRRPQTERA